MKVSAGQFPVVRVLLVCLYFNDVQPDPFCVQPGPTPIVKDAAFDDPFEQFPDQSSSFPEAF
jgi:hypothetical protein